MRPVRDQNSGGGSGPRFDVRLMPPANGVVRAVVTGDVDLTAADPLFEILTTVLDRDDVSGMHVDLSRVRLLDASGVGVLLAVRNRADSCGVAFRVDGASGLPREVLEITGVLGLLGEKD